MYLGAVSMALQRSWMASVRLHDHTAGDWYLLPRTRRARSLDSIRRSFSCEAQYMGLEGCLRGGTPMTNSSTQFAELSLITAAICNSSHSRLDVVM